MIIRAWQADSMHVISRMFDYELLPWRTLRWCLSCSSISEPFPSPLSFCPILALSSSLPPRSTTEMGGKPVLLGIAHILQYFHGSYDIYQWVCLFIQKTDLLLLSAWLPRYLAAILPNAGLSFFVYLHL